MELWLVVFAVLDLPRAISVALEVVCGRKGRLITFIDVRLAYAVAVYRPMSRYTILLYLRAMSLLLRKMESVRLPCRLANTGQPNVRVAV
jgi:hypothetical protein